MGSKDNKLFYIILIAVAAVVVLFINARSGDAHASLSGTTDPIQTAAKGSVTKEVSDFDLTINFKYSYEVDALVIGTKRYSSSSVEGKLSPVDLGLAWGDVAKVNDTVDFHWRQSGRWLYWTINNDEDYNKAGGSSYINTHSSNNHIIPADDTVKKQVLKVRKGDHVKLEGCLVEISGTDSSGREFTWNSSFSREDTGNHACEVFYVTSVQIIK